MKSAGLREWLWDLRCQLRLGERMTTSLNRRRSLLTRKSDIQHYLAGPGSKKLQVGCGKNPLPGWLNTDLLANSEVVYLDATRSLPFPDNSFDVIFTEHVFEHIPYDAGHNFLEESLRILKPNGRIRIATPNLPFLVQLYSHPETDIHQRYIRNSVDRYVISPKFYDRAVALNNFFYNWGHRFIYNFETLTHTLETAGFQKVVQLRPRESSHPDLKNLETHGKLIGDEFNLLETIVVEAEKK